MTESHSRPTYSFQLSSPGEQRGEAAAMMPDLKPELKLVEKFNIVSVSGWFQNFSFQNKNHCVFGYGSK